MKGIGIESQEFFAEIKKTQDLVRESVKRILFTRPFERVNRPNFGVGAENFLFDFTELIERRAKEIITYQLQTYEPRIEVLDVNISRDPQDLYKVKLTIQYVIRTMHEDIQTLTIETTGE